MVGGAGEDCAVGCCDGDIHANDQAVDTSYLEDVGEENECNGLLRCCCENCDL